MRIHTTAVQFRFLFALHLLEKAAIQATSVFTMTNFEHTNVHIAHHHTVDLRIKKIKVLLFHFMLCATRRGHVGAPQIK